MASFARSARSLALLQLAALLVAYAVITSTAGDFSFFFVLAEFASMHLIVQYPDFVFIFSFLQRCWWIQATLSSPMIRVRAGSTEFPVRLPVSTAFLALRPPVSTACRVLRLLPSTAFLVRLPVSTACPALRLVPIVCPVLRAITNKRVAQP
ncbi:Os06g0591500 [Oryza sativa Japonica Group]|uniref:Os06g0591500 protein n=2 Tax=Oryza sativa subsp. japonica TaxID=39947 RepID=A0A0P0WYS4_ORYSJ|nr:hypothetical protein OsJ_21846 [Oryza sativa Japonica Group]BAD32855.1 hypothetical protein [Oryza sativa Japonica Group]BAS98429.1 Os06g0591500 [Oryza sativa Japonica Group]